MLFASDNMEIHLIVYTHPTWAGDWTRPLTNRGCASATVEGVPEIPYNFSARNKRWTDSYISYLAVYQIVYQSKRDGKYKGES